MEGLYGVIGIRHTLLRSIATHVKVVHGLCEDGYPCLLWYGEDTRVRFGKKRIPCARFVYHHLVAHISDLERVYQACENKDGKTCIQPNHLRVKTSDRASEEWQKRKKETDERRNAKKRQKRSGISDCSEWIDKISEDPTSSDIQTPASSPSRDP